LSTAPKTNRKTCPVDGRVMREIKYEQDVIDLCESCHGIWCDDEELRNIITTMDKPIQADFGTPSRVRSEDRKCPTCKSSLHENNFGYNSGIMIDRCPSGHGVWLDFSELEKLQAFYEKWEKASDETRSKYAEALAVAKQEATEGYERSQASVSDRIANAYIIGSLIKKIFG